MSPGLGFSIEQSVPLTDDGWLEAGSPYSVGAQAKEQVVHTLSYLTDPWRLGPLGPSVSRGHSSAPATLSSSVQWLVTGVPGLSGPSPSSWCLVRSRALFAQRPFETPGVMALAGPLRKGLGTLSSFIFRIKIQLSSQSQAPAFSLRDQQAVTH